MIHLHRQWAPVALEAADFRSTMASLLEAGTWCPALLSAELRVLELAGASSGWALRRTTANYYGERTPLGDIFFQSDGNVFYCCSESRRIPSQSDADTQDEPEEEHGIELGLITTRPAGAADQLHAFADQFRAAVLDRVDGRKSRHFSFEWSAPATTPRIPGGSPATAAFGDVKFERASLAPADVAGAEVLAGSAAREMLQELSAAGVAREKDILARRSRRSEDVQQTLSHLECGGLLAKTFLIECRKNSAALTRVDTEAQVRTPEVAALKCPNCGSRFADENLSAAYGLTELGHKLVRKSHWMTIWVTERLVRSGIPIDAIYWNVADGSEEIDIILEFCEQLWILELKDREFGAGDAYPFNYRRARYRADTCFIVTTDKVSKDAKRVLEEARKEARRVRGSPPPVYIEGLENTLSLFTQKAASLALRHAVRRVRPLEAATGLHLSSLIEKVIRQHDQQALPELATAEEEEEFDDIPF